MTPHLSRFLEPILPTPQTLPLVCLFATTRNQGAYYANCTVASTRQAVRNAQLQHWWKSLSIRTLLGVPLCYLLSSVSGIRDAYVVTTTSDMGDFRILRGYRQALESPESSHWREVIVKELEGLMANAMWIVIPESDLSRGANLMRCHMVFTVKRLTDGSIEKLKCRLVVADGNTQRYGMDFDGIFSTVWPSYPFFVSSSPSPLPLTTVQPPLTSGKRI